MKRDALGVRSAMPSTVAVRRCPELMFVPPRFEVYRAFSGQIHATFRDYTPLVEPLSLDEAYLDVTDNLRGIPTAWETAKEMRARMLAETKLTASVRISCNKFLAKLALADHPACLERVYLRDVTMPLGADQSDVGVKIGTAPSPGRPPRGRPRHLNCAHVTNWIRLGLHG
jgi:hypothetical protein